MILQKSFLYADLMLKKHLLLSTLKTVRLLNIFCVNHDTLESSKEQLLFEMEIFFNNVKSLMSFLTFNVSLLNKSIIFLIVLTPNF